MDHAFFDHSSWARNIPDLAVKQKAQGPQNPLMDAFTVMMGILGPDRMRGVLVDLD